MSDGVSVFDGDRLRARLFNADRDKLLVTFDFRNARRDGFSDSGPSRGLDRNGWAQLSLRVARNDWFVNAETEEMEAALAPLAARYGRVQMLGYSMGGYGCFRFAKVLGARAVTAVSPQVSIHPDAVPFDRRYRRDAAEFDAALGDLAPRAVPDLRGVILVDPLRQLDLRHARLLQVLFPGVRLARLAGGGHPASAGLRQAGKAWLVQRAAQQDPPDPAPLIAAHRAGRTGTVAYWATLARAARRRRPGLADRARARAAALAEDTA